MKMLTATMSWLGCQCFAPDMAFYRQLVPARAVGRLADEIRLSSVCV